MTPDPLDWLDEALDQLRAAHLLRRPSARRGRQGAVVRMDERTLVNFGSNDYLGLAADPRLAAAAAMEITTHGWGSGASPLITGRSTSQAELESALARFEGTEAALVFPSGFAANVGTICSLAEQGDVIFSDAKNHASLIDGCRLSRAEIHVYRHADVAHLKQLLADAHAFRRRLIVTDSLFSMDGDIAPLPDLVELATRHDAILVVDEAHATGVLGREGRGACELLGVEAEVPVRVGTFSKALGSIGGFVAGQQRLIDWLFNRARPQVFSTALPSACHRAALAALQAVHDEPLRRYELLRTASQVRAALAAAGWQIGQGLSQIVPVYVGDPAQTLDLSARLRERNLLVPGIRPPTVPQGESLLRISLSFAHDESQIQQLITAFADVANGGD